MNLPPSGCKPEEVANKRGRRIRPGAGQHRNPAVSGGPGGDGRGGERPLVGWKSIATHMGLSQDTTKELARKGLPVHRLPSGRPVAIAEELAQWVKALPLIHGNGKKKHAQTTPGLLDGLEVLRGWRPIARFLRIAPRTARHWRTKYSLPVFESASGGIWTLPLEFRRFDLISNQLIQKRRKEKATRKWRPGEERVDNPLDHGVYGKGQERARVTTKESWSAGMRSALFSVSANARCAH